MSKLARFLTMIFIVSAGVWIGCLLDRSWEAIWFGATGGMIVFNLLD